MAKPKHGIRSRLIATFIMALAVVIIVSLLGTLVAVIIISKDQAGLVSQIQLILESQARGKAIMSVLNHDLTADNLATAATPNGAAAGMRARVVTIDGAVLFDSFNTTEELSVAEVLAWLPVSEGSTVVQHAFTVPLWKDQSLWGHFVLDLDNANTPLAVTHQPRNAAMLLLIGPIIAVLISSLLFFSFGQRIVRPLRRISQTVEQIASGFFDVPPSGITVVKDELDSLAIDIDTMAHKLREAKHEVDQAQYALRYMVATISHDIRTPLTAIIAHSEALEHGVLTANESSKVIGEKATQICELVESLSELTVLQCTTEPWPSSLINVSEIIRTVAIALLPEFERVGMELEVVLPEHPLKARLNEARFRRVIDNLFANALRYAADGRYLGVTAQRTEGKIHIEIIDRGPGIAAEHSDMIFQRFYQCNTSNFRGGSGLGLAIAHETIAKLGGAIGVKPNQPRGCIFWIEVPSSK